MALNTTTLRSRRALLAGTLGGLTALAAQALGRPLPARAEGETIHVGDNLFTAETATWLKNTTTDSDVLRAQSTRAGRGILGQSGSGSGVRGSSTSGAGVEASSASGYGLHAVSDGNHGVFATSRSDAGLFGSSNSGPGAYGESDSGVGAWGSSVRGVGVRARSSAGFALQTIGRLDLETSGVATIPSGSTWVTVSPGVDVTAASFVLLTPRANVAGRDLWFSTDATADTITIRMTSSRPKDTKISWLLLG